MVLHRTDNLNAYLYGNEKEIEELNDDPNGPTHFHRRKDLRDGFVPRSLRLALAALGISSHYMSYLQERAKHEHGEGDDDGAGELEESQPIGGT